MNLSKSKLHFEDDELKRMDGSGNVISTFKAEDIHEVQMKTTYELAGPLFVMIPSLAAAYACKLHVPHPGWSWAGVILFGTLAFLGLVIAKAHYIVVTTRLGKVEYPVMDPIEDANGFVIALQHELDENAGRAEH